MTPHPERRHTRSDDPLVALHHQLACVRRRNDIDAVVVADDAGVVVAGAGAWAVCEELAAYAPLLAELPPALDPVTAEAVEDGDCRLAALRVAADVEAIELGEGGPRLLLCVLGGASRRDAARAAAGGVARILGG